MSHKAGLDDLVKKKISCISRKSNHFFFFNCPNLTVAFTYISSHLLLGLPSAHVTSVLRTEFL